MTEREKFEKWLNTLDKQTLVAMAAKQARIIEELQAAKATSFTLPERMDYELHGDTVINSHHNTLADGYNQCLSDVISMNEEYANSTGSDGWIPVSERLPESEDINALIVVDGDVLDLVFNFSDDEYMGPAFSSVGGGEVYYGAQHVTHWMPLPAAPEVK